MGNSKFVFVTGGVLSSVGKGSVTASIGKILQARGYEVTATKIDPYLNFDSGTMNPYMHGEVFVTEDGGETDLDIGSYERMLDRNVSKGHSITTGQIYWKVIEMERKGEFLGKCVQIIPHVTDEIKRRIVEAAENGKVDVSLVEVGGTVGDIEGAPFLEAARQLSLQLPARDTTFVHVALVPVLDSTGEAKSKPLQHSVQELRRIGIQPDIVIARTRNVLPGELRAKIALFASVPEDSVFSSPNLPSIYLLPESLDKQGLGSKVCEKLGLEDRKPDWRPWRRVVKPLMEPRYRVRISLVGKYAGLADSYMSVLEALRHAGGVCNAGVDVELVEAEELEESGASERLRASDGIIVPGGFGTRGAEGKVKAIEYARKRDVPFLGVCFGFQLSVVEFARNVALMGSANSTEVDPRTPYPVIDLMAEQKGIGSLGATMRLGASPVVVEKGTLAYKLYGREEIYERHRHRYEVNPSLKGRLVERGLRFSGYDRDGKRMEILELPGKFFFFATQYHPEFKSRPGRPDPAYYGFVKAALSKKLGMKALKVSRGFSYAASSAA
ncbi:MAG: CTP synthase [Candidatus Brockarchaeota archaeon]|nr:CTP synthase [Candidatus Brockarchaeota archaeon]